MQDIEKKAAALQYNFPEFEDTPMDKDYQTNMEKIRKYAVLFLLSSYTFTSELDKMTKVGMLA